MRTRTNASCTRATAPTTCAPRSRSRPPTPCLRAAATALAGLIAERAGAADEDGRVVARVLLWDDHDHLCALVQSVLA